MQEKSLGYWALPWFFDSDLLKEDIAERNLIPMQIIDKMGEKARLEEFMQSLSRGYLQILKLLV